MAIGRIHADLLPLATETGRFAARKPNLQNMPRAGADDVGVRNFFMAPEGKVLLSLDFSQIELRVGAFYCRDEKMLETYRTGGDIHDQTATVIFDPGKHDKEQRTIAKNVNFGTFYGLYPNGLRQTLKFKAGLNVTLEQCEHIIANLKAGYPALTLWQEDTKTTVKRKRYIETWLGRRRYLPGIASGAEVTRSFAERCALNTPIQGTAADILKLAMGRIIAELSAKPWLRPLLQVHDELPFELAAERVAEAVSFIKACMETQPFPEYDVPIVADAAVGQRYGELKEMEGTMKTGKILQDLAAELDRQAKSKCDFIVSTEAMQMEDGAELFSLCRPLESGMREVEPFICCYRGKFVAFEVKTPTGKLTKLQETTLQRIRNAMGQAFKVTSLQEVKEILKSLDFMGATFYE